MTAANDPLGLQGQMIGQFRIGHALEGARSGLVYRGWDYAAMGATGEYTPVWLRFFDPSWARNVYGLVRQVEKWRTFEHPRYLKIIGCEMESAHPPLVACAPGDGVVLSERLAAERLDVVQAVKLVLAVAELVERAHVDGLVHLGINDESIVIPKYGNAGPALLGFGIAARFERSDLSAWHYLAPEQLVAQSECDPRADVYALGVLLYRCLAGRYPVAVADGLSADQVAGQLLFGARRELRPHLDVVPIDGTLVTTTERAIHLDRAQRFQSVAEFIRALKSSGLPLSEIETEKSDPKGNLATPPPAGSPELRANADERTMSPGAAVVKSDVRPKTEVLPSETPADLIGMVIKDVRIERPLAEGGMAKIYLAKHVELDRTWAVKVADLSVAVNAERYFHQEARVTAMLRERGEKRVVEVRDRGKFPDGRPYMVMEFIVGKTLDATMRETPLLAIDRVLKITNSVAETLEHAHDAGIVHRDIKPDNIMLESGRGKQQHNLRVLDWGVAKAKGSMQMVATVQGEMAGTPGYMPCESLVGSDVDGRADVFSLACCAYEMLAGKKPFAGPDRMAVIEATMQTHPPPLCSLRPEIRFDLSELVALGMAKRPENRLTMAEFRARLVAIMRDISSSRPAGAPSPMSTQLSAGEPLINIGLPQKPTQARVDADQQDALVRMVEPEMTRPLRAKKPKSKRTGRDVMLTCVVVVVACSVAAGVWMLVHRGTAAAVVPSPIVSAPAALVPAPPTAPAAKPSAPAKAELVPTTIEPTTATKGEANGKTVHKRKSHRSGKESRVLNPFEGE